MEIIEYCDSADTIKREQYYLDLFKPLPSLFVLKKKRGREYNICFIAGSSLGRVTRDEARLNLRNVWLVRLHKNNSSDVSLREFTLDTLAER